MSGVLRAGDRKKGGRKTGGPSVVRVIAVLRGARPFPGLGVLRPGPRPQPAKKENAPVPPVRPRLRTNPFGGPAGRGAEPAIPLAPPGPQAAHSPPRHGLDKTGQSDLRDKTGPVRIAAPVRRASPPVKRRGAIAVHLAPENRRLADSRGHGEANRKKAAQRAPSSPGGKTRDPAIGRALRVPARLPGRLLTSLAPAPRDSIRVGPVPVRPARPDPASSPPTARAPLGLRSRAAIRAPAPITAHPGRPGAEHRSLQAAERPNPRPAALPPSRRLELRAVHHRGAENRPPAGPVRVTVRAASRGARGRVENRVAGVQSAPD